MTALAVARALALPAQAGADHTYQTQWGSQGTAAGQFDGPAGLDADSFDTVYVADYANNRVQRFSPDGELIDSFGSAAGAFTGEWGAAGKSGPATAKFVVAR